MKIIFKKSAFFFIALCLLWTPQAAARTSDVSVSATVDKNEAGLEDTISMKISVQGTRAEPVLSGMGGFTIKSRGSSSQVSIINGTMTSSVEYSYVLFPQTPGTFTIGPFVVRHEGKDIKSNTISLKITKSSQAGAQQNRDVFVTAEIDNDKPYLHEQIIYTFKLYRRVKIGNARLTETPDFQGFITEDLGKEKEYQKVLNGQTYVITEIKTALFSAKTGVLTIGPSTLSCEVLVNRQRRGGFFNDPFFNDSFFGFSESVPKTLRTTPLTVMVQPLPSQDRPKGFDGLVGRFKLSSRLSKDKLQVGESSTLTLILSGTGNLKNIKSIALPKLSNFKVYDDKPAFEPETAGGRAGGRLTVKKALVPLTPGSLRIPPIQVVYFNPDTGLYETEQAGPFRLDVSPSREAEDFKVVEALQQAGGKEAVVILGRGTLPLHTSVEMLSPSKIDPLSFSNAGLFFLPIAGFLAALLIKRNKERSAADNATLARSRSAYKHFCRQLPELQKALKNDDPRFCPLASKAYKDFIGDKFNLAGSALTPDELKRLLSGAGIPTDTVQEIVRILGALDSAQYGFTQIPAAQKQSAFKTLKQTAALIKKKIRS